VYYNINGNLEYVKLHKEQTQNYHKTYYELNKEKIMAQSKQNYLNKKLQNQQQDTNS